MSSINGKQIGQRFGTLYMPKDEWSENATTGGTCTRTYRALYASWRATAPLLKSRHPAAAYYLLETRDVRQLETNALLCDVMLGYKWDIAANVPGFAQIPADLVDENDTTAEVEIERHPSFDDPAVFPEEDKIFDDITGRFLGFKKESDWFGVTKFIVGSFTTTITKYSLAPFPPPTDVGKLMVPPGYAAGLRQWLVVGQHRGKQGIFFTRSTTYHFSALPFVDGLYPPA